MINEDVYIELSYAEYADRILGGWTADNALWGLTIFKNRHKLNDGQFQISTQEITVKKFDAKSGDDVGTINLEISIKLNLELGQVDLKKSKMIQIRALFNTDQNAAMNESYGLLMRRLHELKLVESVKDMVISVQARVVKLRIPEN